MMAAVLGVIAYPLLKPQLQPSARTSAGDAVLEDLLSQRNAAYEGIKELEFERDLGNLSAADYEALREEYRKKAARILIEIEETARKAPDAAVAVETSPEDEIEQAVRRMRQHRTQPRAGQSCPLCHEEVTADDRFCSNCGAILSRFCSNCGDPREPGDRFCRSCGAEVGVPS